MTLIYSFSNESDFRFGADLCEEEMEFLKIRDENTFEAMKTFLGKEGPSNMKEVSILVAELK